jgi:hypothetical protein
MAVRVPHAIYVWFDQAQSRASGHDILLINRFAVAIGTEPLTLAEWRARFPDTLLQAFREKNFGALRWMRKIGVDRSDCTRTIALSQWLLLLALGSDELTRWLRRVGFRWSDGEGPWSPGFRAGYDVLPRAEYLGFSGVEYRKREYYLLETAIQRGDIRTLKWLQRIGVTLADGRNVMAYAAHMNPAVLEWLAAMGISADECRAAAGRCRTRAHTDWMQARGVSAQEIWAALPGAERGGMRWLLWGSLLALIVASRRKHGRAAPPPELWEMVAEQCN